MRLFITTDEISGAPAGPYFVELPIQSEWSGDFG